MSDLIRTSFLESSTSRRTDLKKRIEEILDKSCYCQANTKLLNTFSATITAFLQVQIKQTCDRVQAAKTKRTKLRTDKKGILVNK